MAHAIRDLDVMRKASANAVAELLAAARPVIRDVNGKSAASETRIPDSQFRKRRTLGKRGGWGGGRGSGGGAEDDEKSKLGGRTGQGLVGLPPAFRPEFCWPPNVQQHPAYPSQVV